MLKRLLVALLVTVSLTGTACSPPEAGGAERAGDPGTVSVLASEKAVKAKVNALKVINAQQAKAQADANLLAYAAQVEANERLIAYAAAVEKERARRAAVARAERAARERAAAASAPAANYAPSSGGMPAILIRIRGCESGHNYTAQNPRSSASGAYQFLDSTWMSWRGSSTATRAMYASPAEQDAAALRLYNAQGTRPWNASRYCWG